MLFDIGSTLVMGPGVSPNKLIAQYLELSETGSYDIANIIMRNEFSHPEEACFLLAKHYNIDDELKNKICSLWYEQESGLTEVPGATEVIKYLKAKGYKIGLISDIWVPYFRAFQKECPEIVRGVDSVTLSFKEGIKKPSIELVKKALRALDVLPENTIMVGDTYTEDLQPAFELGLKTIWVLSRPERERLSLVKVLNGLWFTPDYTISQINEITNLNLFKEK